MIRKDFEKYLNKKVELVLNKQLPKYIKIQGGMVSRTAYTKGRLTNILEIDDKVFLELNTECKTNIEEVKDIKIQEDRKDIVDGKLITPFGEVKTYLDGKEVSYKIKEEDVSICFPDVEAIYSLTIKLPVDNNEHIVSCNIHKLKEYVCEFDYDTDENELTLNIENEQFALAIGCSADNCEEEALGWFNDDFSNHKHLYQKYLRYSATTSIAECCDNGIQYRVFDFSQRGYVVFGISWIKDPGIYSSNEKNYNDRSFQAEFAASLNSYDESWENVDVMYTRDKMKELLTERDKLDVYDEYHTEIIWGKILDLLQSREDIDKFAEYMDKEMTYDEYGTLGEIIDEIDYKYITKKFVESLKKLIDKYPCKTIPKEWNDNSYEKHMLRVFEEELAGREKEKN